MTERSLVGRFVAVLCWSMAVGVAAVFVWMVVDMVVDGGGLVSWDFLTGEPRDAGRSGGIGSVLVSTTLLLVVCMSSSLPIALGCGAFLAEIARTGDRRAQYVRASLDILAATPSIVFGLFGAILFGRVLGFGFSIMSGGLTLACMVLPILVRTVETAFRTVPDDLRTSAAALGLSRVTTVRSLVFPCAAPGIAVGLVLGIGRALAETAALVFTSGYVTRMPSSLLDSGRSLSVHIYDLAMNVPGGEQHAYATALVLVGVLLGINSAASWASERWLPDGIRRL